MKLRRAKALIWQREEAQLAPVSTIPRELHDTARRSLIKLFRDSLHLNDQVKYETKRQGESVEEDIIDDFQIVAEYIQYLEMWLEKNGMPIED
jgi:hypothetical protein